MMHFHIDIERWPLKTPFRITGHTFTDSEVIVVTVTEGGVSGRGEAAGVYYRGESAQTMVQQLGAVRPLLERGVTRDSLRSLLPPGGARNAVDCALWDLEARRSGVPAWRLAGLEAPKPLATTHTIGADAPQVAARMAAAYKGATRLKLKLTGEEEDEARLRAVRAARPDAWIAVDANQAYDVTSLRAVLSALLDADVQLIEQPVRIGSERQLAGFDSPIPLAADESVQSLSDLPKVVGLFDVVNIKLDKCGGLTEALAMAAQTRRLGMKPMVGCMAGTSLAMAPACLAGAHCDLVDLDAPLFLAKDRAPAALYDGGTVHCPDGWGVPSRGAGATDS